MLVCVVVFALLAFLVHPLLPGERIQHPVYYICFCYLLVKVFEKQTRNFLLYLCWLVFLCAVRVREYSRPVGVRCERFCTVFYTLDGEQTSPQEEGIPQFFGAPRWKYYFQVFFVIYIIFLNTDRLCAVNHKLLNKSLNFLMITALKYSANTCFSVRKAVPIRSFHVLHDRWTIRLIGPSQ